MNDQQNIIGNQYWHTPQPANPPATHNPQTTLSKTSATPLYSVTNACYSPYPIGSQDPAVTSVVQKHCPASRAVLQLLTPPTLDNPTFYIYDSQAPSEPGASQHNGIATPGSEAASSLTPIPVLKSYAGELPHLEESMDPYQVQTPPPTRDASSTSRQERRGQVYMQQTPSHPTPGMLVNQGYMGYTPQAQQTPTLMTPNNYAAYNFSPVEFQYSHPVPMSAPPVPYGRTMWDQSPVHQGAPLQYPQSASHNPFLNQNAISPTAPSWPSANPSPIELQGAFQPNTSFISQDAAGGDFWMTSNTVQHPQAQVHPHTQMQMQAVPATAQNPAMNPPELFHFTSAPPAGQILQSAPAMDTTSFASHIPTPPPSQHTQPPPKERGVMKKKSRSNLGTANPPSATAPRPAIQRSNTDSGFRNAKRNSLPVAQVADPVPRRLSPLKRQAPTPLKVIPEATAKPRQRTRLIIDENGRATTVTVDDDGVPTPRKASQWDEGEDTEEDSEEDIPVISARNSFIGMPSELPRSGKHPLADFNSDRLSNAKRPLSRNLSSSSLASLGQRLQAAQAAAKQNDARRVSTGSFLSNVDSGPMSNRRVSADVPADAQAALKRVRDDRKLRQEQDPQAILRAHNQRWSQATHELQPAPKLAAPQHMMPQQHAMPQHHQYTQVPLNLPEDPFFTSLQPPSLSPGANTAESDAQTPHTDCSVASLETTRCICGVVDPNETRAMIQCDTCSRWLHAQCIGLHPAHLPNPYFCGFCHGMSPVKGPAMQQGMGGMMPGMIQAANEQFFGSPMGYGGYQAHSR